jgi:hypothetical protein
MEMIEFEDRDEEGRPALLDYLQSGTHLLPHRARERYWPILLGTALALGLITIIR